MSEVLHPEMRAVVAQDVTVRGIVSRVSELMEIPEAHRATVLASGLTVQTQIDKIALDLEEAQTIVVDSPIMLEAAQEIAGRLATVCADAGMIETERKALVAPLNNLVKWINTGYNAPRSYISCVLGGADGKGGLKGKILAYHKQVQEEERLRQEEERLRRQKAAEEAAAAEAKAIADAKALVDAAAAAQATGSEQVADAMLTQAAVQVDSARQQASVASAALYAPMTSHSGPAPRASGVREVYKGTVTSRAKLIIMIGKQLEADDHSNEDLLDVNESNLNKRAAMQKLNLRLDGVQVTVESALSTRKKAL